MSDKINEFQPITPFQFWCQKVIPLIYDDSLSYYEVLCKLKVKLNEVIASQNALGQNVQEFEGYVNGRLAQQDNAIATINAKVDNALIELKKWVDEQLEVYTKEQLQNWLDDGTLASLIAGMLNITLSFNTVSDMVNNGMLREGNYVVTLGYHSLGDGGGGKYRILSATRNTPNGMDIIKINDTLSAVLVIENEINVKKLGAYGNDINDDRPYLQRGIDLASTNNLTLNLDSGTYRIASANPNSTLNCLTVNSRSLTIKGNSTFDTSINVVLPTPVTNVLYVTSGSDYLTLKDFSINANKWSVNGIIFDDYSYNCNLSNLLVSDVLEYCYYLNTYVTLIEKCNALRGKTGFYISGVGENIATSITMNSCYSNIMSEYGYQFNNLMYSSFNACACDNVSGIGYYVIGRSLSFNGCGCENCNRVMMSPNYRGITISGLYVVGCGNASNPPEYLMEFGGGTDVVISGVDFWSTNTSNYKYKLGLTGSNYGYECVNCLDLSILPNECVQIGSSYWMGNHGIVLFADTVYRDKTININADQLVSTLNGLPEFNYGTITINIAEGTSATIGALSYITSPKGSGRIVINGGIINFTDRRGMTFQDTCSIIFNNTVFNMTVAIRTSICLSANNTRLSVNNCQFNNTSGGQGGACVLSNYNATVAIAPNNKTSGDWGSDNLFPVFGSNTGTGLLQNYTPTQS